jgi:hypothetical protein
MEKPIVDRRWPQRLTARLKEWAYDMELLLSDADARNSDSFVRKRIELLREAADVIGTADHLSKAEARKHYLDGYETALYELGIEMSRLRLWRKEMDNGR